MKNAPIAYQIYSARKEAEQDLLSVLRQLKALGYDGVEFAGVATYLGDAENSNVNLFI